ERSKRRKNRAPGWAQSESRLVLAVDRPKLASGRSPSSCRARQRREAPRRQSATRGGRLYGRALAGDVRAARAVVTRRIALIALFAAIVAIAIGYASAFSRSGAPLWGAWLLALGIPVALGSIMILGAVRGTRGIGSLKFP